MKWEEMKNKEEIYRKLRSLILFLEVHPENEDNSEMRDILSSVKEIPLLIHEYATEAIKADREKVADRAKVRIVPTPVGDYTEVDKSSILNLPIELP